jgi:hypothetical protein
MCNAINTTLWFASSRRLSLKPPEPPGGPPDIQTWFAIASSLKQLQQSDSEMIRVLDDLIQVLTSKGVIRITDLPPAAQVKVIERTQARTALGGLSELINDDESGLI